MRAGLVNLVMSPCVGVATNRPIRYLLIFAISLLCDHLGLSQLNLQMLHLLLVFESSVLDHLHTSEVGGGVRERGRSQTGGESGIKTSISQSCSEVNCLIRKFCSVYFYIHITFPPILVIKYSYQFKHFLRIPPSHWQEAVPYWWRLQQSFIASSDLHYLLQAHLGTLTFRSHQQLSPPRPAYAGPWPVSPEPGPDSPHWAAAAGSETSPLPLPGRQRSGPGSNLKLLTHKTGSTNCFFLRQAEIYRKTWTAMWAASIRH